KFLRSFNVERAREVAVMAKRQGVQMLILTATKCLWAKNIGRPVREDDAPEPIEIYGRSKLAAEKVLEEYRGDFDCVILRTPTIMDAGRLGLLAILFEFIAEGRKVWVVGSGAHRYPFIYAQDLAS